MKKGILAVAIFAAALHAGTAASETGKAVSVGQRAYLENVNGQTVLRYGGEVLLGETVITNQTGLVQLEFTDGTRIVVGPSAALLIEEFLLDSSSGQVSRFTVNALGGTFRFISGNSDKTSYAFKTPTATLGIRGTVFDVAIRPDGTTGTAVHRGEVEYCGLDRRCLTLATPCSVATNFRTRQTRMLEDIETRDDTLLNDFPYIIGENQRRLRRENRVDIRSCGESLGRRIALERVQMRRDGISGSRSERSDGRPVQAPPTSSPSVPPPEPPPPPPPEPCGAPIC